MELVRRGAVALWRQIGEILKREIETGVFLPGNRMSTEHELTARFSVTRHTVRRAIADLEEQGLVRVTHGSGIYVQERVIDYNVTRRTRFSANLAQQSIASGAIMLSSGESEADQEMAEALEIPLGEPLVFMEVAGEADGRRITCSINYFPRKRFSGIIEAYRDTRSITAALKQCGVNDYLRKKSLVLARMPSPRVAETLDILKNRPVLVTKSVNIDLDRVPIQYNICYYAADWVQLVFEP